MKEPKKDRKTERKKERKKEDERLVNEWMQLVIHQLIRINSTSCRNLILVQ